MKILVVNCGSSSLKYQLIDMESNNVLAKGKCDRIGAAKGEIGSPFIEYKGPNGKKIIEELPLENHLEAFKNVESNEIKIEFAGPLNPVVIKPLEGESFTSVVLPVRLH